MPVPGPVGSSHLPRGKRGRGHSTSVSEATSGTLAALCPPPSPRLVRANSVTLRGSRRRAPTLLPSPSRQCPLSPCCIPGPHQLLQKQPETAEQSKAYPKVSQNSTRLGRSENRRPTKKEGHRPLEGQRPLPRGRLHEEEEGDGAERGEGALGEHEAEREGVSGSPLLLV